MSSFFNPLATTLTDPNNSSNIKGIIDSLSQLPSLTGTPELPQIKEEIKPEIKEEVKAEIKRETKDLPCGLRICDKN